MYLRTVQAAINEPTTIPVVIEDKINTLTSKLNAIEIENTVVPSYGKSCASQRTALFQCFESNLADSLKCQDQVENFNQCVNQL